MSLLLPLVLVILIIRWVGLFGSQGKKIQRGGAAHNRGSVKRANQNGLLYWLSCERTFRRQVLRGLRSSRGKFTTRVGTNHLVPASKETFAKMALGCRWNCHTDGDRESQQQDRTEWFVRAAATIFGKRAAINDTQRK